MTTSKTFKQVEISLTDAQILKLGEEQAEAQIELEAMGEKLERLIESQKAARNDVKERIAKQEQIVSGLAKKIDTRTDHVDVEVQLVFDDARKMKAWVRVDEEGKARENDLVGKWEPMTLNEMAESSKRAQGNLFDPDADIKETDDEAGDSIRDEVEDEETGGEHDVDDEEEDDGAEESGEPEDAVEQNGQKLVNARKAKAKKGAK